MKNKSLRKPEIRVRSMVLAVAACFVAANSMALPVGPQVVNGTATISQVGNTLNVTNSNGAILNWQSFNIGANETTRFIQPSASSAVLNRVLAQDPSVILGNLTSNGKVWLINPAGILVGAGARIDTAAFVASTLNITNADFLANRMRFDAGNGQAGNVVNQGTITTPLGGSVYLVGANVSNDGLITTPKGETILAAGNTVELIDSATPGVKVEITGTQGNATNLGEIVAQAGRIGIAGVIVRNSGQLNASSVVEDGGKIFLRASKDAYVDGAGRIVTTGKVGGQVEVLGERVAVMDQASIDASGEDGGGKVLVGGDWQGKNPDVRNAQISYFGPEAEIKVNATKVGAGGTAVVWADDTTRAYGRIEAKGGAEGGEGGMVETSGKRWLDIAGARVDTRAADGSAGSWLLDPTDITISGTAQTTGGTLTSIFNAGANTATIYAGDINSALYSSNVSISSASSYGGVGGITIESDVTIQNNSEFRRDLAINAEGAILMHYGAQILGGYYGMNVSLSSPSYTAEIRGRIETRGGNVAIKGDHVYLDTNAVINATTDGLAGNSTAVDSAYGGRIVIDAGTGTFTMQSGSFIGTTNQSRIIDANGEPTGYVAIGIKARDVSIANDATIKLNYATGGSSYGGGDLGFIPTSTGNIELGTYSSGEFMLDNAELARLLMPGAGATNCGTVKEGCRIWIGNVFDTTDPLLGPLPITSQNIVASSADFTKNGANLVPKRVQLSTTGTISDQGTSLQAGHLALISGANIGAADNPFSFYGNSLMLTSSNGNIWAESTGTGDLALRRATANNGNVSITTYGSVVLLPYFANQAETAYGSFTLNAGGNLTMAAYGGSYTGTGVFGQFTETAPAAATIKTLRSNDSTTVQLGAIGNIAMHYGAGISGTSGGPLSVTIGSETGNVLLAGGIRTYGGDVVIAGDTGVTLGDGTNTTAGTFGINTRRDGLLGGTQDADAEGYGGRILIDADNDRNGAGTFTMNAGVFIGTTNQSRMLNAAGSFHENSAVAIGIIAADVAINNTATIKLNTNSSVAYGGGGDIGFLPTSNGAVVLGNDYGGSFTLDNTELTRILMPNAATGSCGTGQQGCRIWIGNTGVADDPLVGALPITNQNIVVNQADFTLNGEVQVAKRVQLSTTGTVNDAGTGAVGDYFGIKAGHAYAYGGAGVGGSDADGLSFYAGSVALSSGGNITATSVGGGNLALRRANAVGAINIDVLNGGVTLLPYFTGQTESTQNNFTLTADGNIDFAKYGSSYLGETAPSTATIRAGGSLTLTSRNGSIAIVGDHAATGGINVNAYGGISVTDGGFTTAGNFGMSADGDITLSGISRGVIIKSTGTMTIEAANIRAYGGNNFNAGAVGSGMVHAFYGTNGVQDISGYGAGVLLASSGNQNITAGGQILLQAGSTDNTAYGSSSQYETGHYGASVVLKSGSSQTISAHELKLFAGAAGHDNLAQLSAYGSQTITLGTDGGSASLLSVYGGGSAGSYNNRAIIEQQSSDGSQSITLYGANANLMIVAGSGTGLLGHIPDECASIPACASGGNSNNTARIRSGGTAMEIDLFNGGTVSLTGGSNGIGNNASIDFNSNSSYGLWIGSEGGPSSLPSIVLNGGSDGGALYGTPPNDAWLTNGAEIDAGNDNGSGYLSIDAAAISLYGGAGLAAPAIISARNSEILVYGGNLTLTGGSNNTSTDLPMASGAIIGNDEAATVLITTYGGGNVVLNGGSGVRGATMIGSLLGGADVTINSSGAITATGNVGGVFVGSLTAVPYGGSTVILDSIGNIGFDSASHIRASTLTAEGLGLSLLGLNYVTTSIGLTSYGSAASGDIAFNLGSSSFGVVDTSTDTGSSQTISFYGSAFGLSGGVADMEGDSLQLFATTGNIVFSNGAGLTNAKNVVLNAADGGIYNNNANLTVANIDVSTYGGSVILTGTELGLPYSYATDVGSPITLRLGGASTVQATATSGGTNLLQTQGTLFTSKYTLSNQAGNHVHLQAPAGIAVDSTLNLAGRSLVLASAAGSVSQGAAAPITADLLAVTSYGGIDLYASNSVGMFSASNSTLGNIRFMNSSALAVTDNYNYNNGFGVRNWTPNNGSSDGGVEITVAGNLTLAGGIQAYGPITLHAAGNLIQGGSGITNSYGTGTNDISIYGADITLTNVSSQRHIVLTASGNVSLVSPYYGYVDDSYFLYNLPFAFDFYGTSYTQAYITSNGLITFGAGTSSYSDSISGLGSYRAIAPAWNDWIQRTSTGRDIFIKQPTSNSLAVQWNAARYSNESKTANFEAVLYDSGNIQFNYGVANDSFSGDVTIGLSNGTTALASQLMSVSNFSLNNLVSTTFTPTAGGYQETVSGSAVTLTNTSGATTGAMQMSGGYGNDTALHAIGNVTAQAGGTFTGYSGIDASLLTVTSTGGFNLSGYSYLDSIALTNNGSGSLTLSNNHAAPLTINSISNAGTGAILVDTYGAVVVNGAVSGGGDVTINAHSPITVNSGTSISGGGLITLAALSSGSGSTTDVLNISGSVASTGGNIALSGGSGVTLGAQASLNVASGKSISASSTYGNVTVDPGATIVGSLSSSSSTPMVTPTVTQVTTATITTATETATNSLSNTSTTTPPPPPPASTGPATSGSGGLLMPSAGQTIGGSEGSFGSSSPSATSTSTASASSSTSSSSSTTQTADSSGSSSASSSNGQQESSQESKPAQKSEEKKEKKDDKKKAEEKSEGKKDEKAASKKVSQCT